MAITYSDLKIAAITTGTEEGDWGDITNANLTVAIEEAIVGSTDVSFSGSDVTLTLTNTTSTQPARNLRLNLTGTSGGARNLVVPSIEKIYIVNNGLADTVTVKTAAGSGIAVPAGKTMYVYDNGTNVVDAITHLSSLTLATALPVASGGTGATTQADARTNLGLGTMAVQPANNIAVTGGTINDVVIGNTNPTSGAFTLLSSLSGITGNLTGNVTGNLTGNVTGNVSGNVTGDVTGTASGNLTTSSFTGANQSKASNGFQVLPGGVIMQWGSITAVQNTATTVTLPKTFPTAFGSVTVTMVENTNDDRNTLKVGTTSLSSFTIRNTSGTNFPAYWMAIGY